MNKPVFPIFQIKVTLLHIEPPIWRRLLVRSDATLADFHPILQAAMGWTNSHLHQFRKGDVAFSYPYDLDHLVSLTAIDSSTVHLYNVIPVVRPFRDRPNPVMYYDYDFGDGWTHELEFEENLIPQPRQMTPVCIAGARCGPPENCGGAGGYVELLKVLANPAHPDYEEYKEWVGMWFKSEAFDLSLVNYEMRRRRQNLYGGQKGATKSGRRWVAE